MYNQVHEKYKNIIGASVGGCIPAHGVGQTPRRSHHAQLAYVTMCGLDPSSVRSYLRAQGDDHGHAVSWEKHY